MAPSPTGAPLRIPAEISSTNYCCMVASASSAALCLGGPSGYPSNCSDDDDDAQSLQLTGRRPPVAAPLPPQAHQLHSYLSALRYERHKIDAFQQELPFCIRLLDEAIQSSEMLLAQFTRCAHQQQQELQANSNDTLHPIISSHHHQQQQPLLKPRSNYSMACPNLESTFYIPSYNNVLEHNYLQGKLKLQQIAKENNDSRCFNKDVVEQQANVKSQRVQLHDINKDGEIAQLDGYRFKFSTIGCNDDDDSMILSSFNLQSNFSCTPNEYSNCGNHISNDCQQQLMPGRKVRRRWSKELHQQFLQALQQLGGAQLATPKQIREVMKVEGLTNDEVKSHLQKFRLHAKQLNGPQEELAPQQQIHAHPLVFFGGIWMPIDVSPIDGNANTCTTIH